MSPRRRPVVPALLPALVAALVVVPLAGLGAIVPAAPAVAADATCLGLAATIQDDVGIARGTSGSDVISAGPDVRVVESGGGSDVICIYGSTDVEDTIGNDTVYVRPDPTVPLGSTTRADIDLGRGSDTVRASLAPGMNVLVSAQTTQRQTLIVDTSPVAGGDWLLDLDGADRVVRSGDTLLTMRGSFEAVQMTAPNVGKVTLEGGTLDEDVVLDTQGSRKVKADLGDGDDTLAVRACRGVVKGGSGRDLIKALAADPSVCQARRGLRIKGGDGRDRMFGTKRADTLLGGKGRDTAVGHAGKDRCQAERTKSCER